MKKRMVTSCALVLAGILCGAVIGYAIPGGYDRWTGDLADHTIGKNVTLIADEGAGMDASELKRELNGGSPLSLLDKDATDKLVAFMDRNDLMITPGEYSLNQADTFEELLEKLYFRTGARP